MKSKILYNLRIMTALYGVFGKSIEYSLSPKIFNFLFEKLKIDAKYEIFSVQKAEEIKKIAEGLNLKGFNITVPFKTEAVGFLDYPSNRVKVCGSVNAVLVKDGKFYGENTDYLGFLKLLDEFEITLRKKKVLIIGAGGVARSVVAAIFSRVKEMGHTEVFVTNRTIEKAKNLASRFGFKVLPFFALEKGISEFEVIVNCVPVLSFSRKNIRKNATFIDFVYHYADGVNRSYEFKGSHFTYINGFHPLIFQAYYNFMFWFGKQCNLKLFYRALNMEYPHEG